MSSDPLTRTKRCGFKWLSLVPSVPGRCGRVLRNPTHSHHRSGPRRADSRSAWCRGWRRGSTSHSAYRRWWLPRWRPPQPPGPCTLQSRTEETEEARVCQSEKQPTFLVHSWLKPETHSWAVGWGGVGVNYVTVTWNLGESVIQLSPVHLSSWCGWAAAASHCLNHPAAHNVGSMCRSLSSAVLCSNARN